MLWAVNKKDFMENEYQISGEKLVVSQKVRVTDWMAEKLHRIPASGPRPCQGRHTGMTFRF
jgi:hypothetical protein